MNKTVSTIKAGQVLDATHFLQVAVNPVKVFRIEGNVNSTSGTSYYIQLHGGAPGAGAVPLFSVLAVPSSYASGVNGFSFIYTEGLDTARMTYPASTIAGGDNISPVYVAISSTDTIYTSVAANTDVSVTFESFFVDLPSQTIVSSAGSATLTAWNDVVGNSNNRLLSFIVDNTNNPGTEFLLLFAITGPSATTVPLASWTVPASLSFTQTFGSGLLCTSESPVASQHYGCYLTMSATKQFYTAPSDTFASIKAAYISL